MIATITSVTKKVSLMMPMSKATVANMIPGPPLVFIATARLKLESQSFFINLEAINVPAVSNIVVNNKNPRNGELGRVLNLLLQNKLE